MPSTNVGGVTKSSSIGCDVWRGGDDEVDDCGGGGGADDVDCCGGDGEGTAEVTVVVVVVVVVEALFLGTATNIR